MKPKITFIAIFLFSTFNLFSALNYWEGDISVNWHSSGNWSLNHVPDATEDVIIPGTGVTHFPDIYSSDAECRNLTLHSNATLDINFHHNLNIYGEANISGDIKFLSDLCEIHFHDDVNWWSGSQCLSNFSSSNNCSIYATGNWKFGTGANVVLDNVVCFLNNSSGTYQTISCNSANSSFYFLSVMYNALVSSSSTEDMVISNELYISASSHFYNYSSHKVVVYNHFDYNGNIRFPAGTLELNNIGSNIFFLPGDYLNNLSVTTTSQLNFYNYADIRGDITVSGSSGIVFIDELELGGSFTSDETSSVNKMSLTGNGLQNLNNLTCDTMYLDKSSGEMRIIPFGTVSCQHFDYVKGAYTVYGGNFEILDLMDDAIYGEITVTSGNLDIHQDNSHFTDLDANLTISGGVCRVHGGYGDSYWSYGDDASITMSGGALYYIDNGIRIYNSSSHSFSENITGGTIITNYDFRVYRDNFTPEGGTISLQGTTNATVSQVTGSCLFNLEIYKGTKNGISGNYVQGTREGNNNYNGKSNKVTAGSNLDINGYFMLHSGNFVAGDTIRVAGSWFNYTGTSAFDEGTSVIIFDGNTNQNCYTEDFYTLAVDKFSGALIFPDGETINCQNWDWIQGAYHIDGATVTFNDLVDDGIYGTIVLNDGIFNIHQGTNYGEYVDLNCSLGIYGGEMNVYGGADDSYWTYNGDASIGMYGGSLSFRDVGIWIIDNANSFVSNITGGSIATSGDFKTERSNFNPVNGQLIMFGTGDNILEMETGSNLFDLVIDKSSKGYSFNKQPKMPRKKSKQGSGKGNSVSALTGLDINGDFILTAGTFVSPSVMTVAGNWDNQVGDFAFLQGTGNIIFDGTETANILHSERFYDLTVNSTETTYFSLLAEDMAAVYINHNLHIQQGSFSLIDDANLDVNGSIIIENDAGLFVNDVTVNVHGDWDDNTDSRTGFEGFHCGTSSVIFDGTNTQSLHCTDAFEIFHDLEINNSGSAGSNSLEIVTNIKVNGNMKITDGTFSTTAAPYFHWFTGDSLIIEAGGSWVDNNSTAIFRESVTQSVIINGTANFSAIEITKNFSFNNVAITGDFAFDELILNKGTLSLTGNSCVNRQEVSVTDDAVLTLNPGMSIISDDGAAIFVLAGGTLNLNGTAANRCAVSGSGSGDFYDFDVYGEISAVYTDFENMSQQGIYIRPGSIISNGGTFDNCSFANGQTGGTYLKINNDQIITSDGVEFTQNNWGGFSNVTKTNNAGNVTFINFSGDFAGEDYDDDIYNRINWDEGIREVQLKVFIEGAYSGSTMQTLLNAEDLLPLNQPYNVAPWNYSGTENVPAIPNANVVDWVLVEYRDATSSANAIASTSIGQQAAFLLNDGRIVDLDGSSNLSFSHNLNHSLFVVVWHRNHLGIMSANALTEVAGIYSYDFTTLPGQAYGINPQKDLGSGVYGMFAGDANADGTVSTDDLTIWRNNAGTTGYIAMDVNLDSQVDNKDKNDYCSENLSVNCQVPD